MHLKGMASEKSFFEFMTFYIDLGNNNARSVLFSLPCPYQLSIWSVISSNFFYYVLGECYCVHLRMYTLPLVSISQFYIFPPRIFDLA